MSRDPVLAVRISCSGAFESKRHERLGVLVYAACVGQLGDTAEAGNCVTRVVSARPPWHQGTQRGRIERTIPGNEVLLIRRKELASLARLSRFPGPSRELVDEKVSRRYEFVWGESAGFLELGVAQDWREVVADGPEVGLEEGEGGSAGFAVG